MPNFAAWCSPPLESPCFPLCLVQPPIPTSIPPMLLVQPPIPTSMLPMLLVQPPIPTSMLPTLLVQPPPNLTPFNPARCRPPFTSPSHSTAAQHNPLLLRPGFALRDAMVTPPPPHNFRLSELRYAVLRLALSSPAAPIRQSLWVCSPMCRHLFSNACTFSAYFSVAST